MSSNWKPRPIRTAPSARLYGGKGRPRGEPTAATDETRRIPEHFRSDKVEQAADLSDDDAIKEAKQLTANKSAEEIEAEAAQNEHARSEKFRDQFEKIAVAGLSIAFLVLVLMVLSWVAHILLPEEFHWLTQEQISKVQNLVTGGVVASLAVGHLKKRIGHS